MPKRPRRSRDPRLGFSLMEILTVLVILGILSALAAPALRGLVSTSGAEGALNQVTADIAYARMLAVRNGQRVEVRFLAGGEYRIVRNPGGSETVVKTVSVPRDYPGVTLAPTGSLSFNTRGLLQAGGVMTVTATRDGVSKSMSITGAGRVYRDF